MDVYFGKHVGDWLTASWGFPGHFTHEFKILWLLILHNQLYNSIITAHAILMIFFMVNKQVFMLNSDAASYDFQASSHDVLIDNNNNNNDENKSPLNNSPARPELLPIPIGAWCASLFL